MRRAVVAIILLFFALPLIAQQTPKYAAQKPIELGGDGGWDYLTFDKAGHRLFIARATRVMVVDLNAKKLAAEIPNTPGVHGVALAPDVNRGFISNGEDSTVSVIDLGTLKETARLHVGDRPDAIVFDPASRRVFTFNARSHDATAIDVDKVAVVGTVPLGGKPEFAAADGAGKMFVNIEDTAEIVPFDTKKLAPLARWKIADCEEPTGLAMDIANKLLFSGCHNQKLAVTDAATGKAVASLPIGMGVDGVAFDPGTKLVFSSNGGSGTLTVIREESPTKFSVAQDLPTAPTARTLALDPDTHVVYVVAAKIEMRPKRHVVPDTFQLIEVTPEK